MKLVKILLVVSVSCAASFNMGCSVYRSEGRKNFDSASNDYPSQSRASSLSHCEMITPQLAQELLESPPQIPVQIEYSEEGQTYYSCSPSLTNSSL